jgi:hypothetical protein
MAFLSVVRAGRTQPAATGNLVTVRGQRYSPSSIRHDRPRSRLALSAARVHMAGGAYEVS